MPGGEILTIPLDSLVPDKPSVRLGFMNFIAKREIKMKSRRNITQAFTSVSLYRENWDIKGG